jgi:hypothetical protein
VHDFDYSAVLLEEVEGWRRLFLLALGVVLQDLVDFEAQWQDNLVLLAEL